MSCKTRKFCTVLGLLTSLDGGPCTAGWYRVSKAFVTWAKWSDHEPPLTATSPARSFLRVCMVLSTTAMAFRSPSPFTRWMIPFTESAPANSPPASVVRVAIRPPAVPGKSATTSFRASVTSWLLFVSRGLV